MTRTAKRLRNVSMPGGLSLLADALELIVGGSGVKFDETVEAAVQLGIDAKKSDQAVRGSVVLPAGSGKTVRVAVVAGDDLANEATQAGADKVGFEEFIAEIKTGKIEFDVLIAVPDAMRQLAAAGKVLGPRGLMPNPKTGTVTKNIAQAVKNAKAGQVQYRADKSGIVHAPVGKASFKRADLQSNIEALLESLKRAKPSSSKGVYLRRLALSATMGRAVRVDIAAYR